MAAQAIQGAKADDWVERAGQLGLSAVALGLGAFGLYSFGEARYRQIS